MIAITINALAIILGSAIGAIARKGIREKYITVLNTAMGLAALVLGMNVAMSNMQKTAYPVLFIFCLSFGGLVGTLLKLDHRMERAMARLSRGSNLSEGITIAILLCCVGTLSIMGPVNSALYGDDDCYRIQLWLWYVCNRGSRFPLDVWYLRSGQTFPQFYFRGVDYRNLHCRRCADSGFGLGGSSYKGLQNNQFVACFADAHVFPFFQASF